MSIQLPLNIRLRDSAAFDNFYPGRNQEAVRQLVTLATGGVSADTQLYLYGPAGTGKTHLLQAACRAQQEAGGLCVYVPLAQAGEFSPQVLEDLEAPDLVCLDDVERVAGDRDWETAIFNLCEQRRALAAPLVVTAANTPRAIGLGLADLATRLGWGPVYQLQVLSDEAKQAALQWRARRRGLSLSDEVARFILNRYPRDTQALFRLLERLDDVSLARQRAITIPFLRSLEAASPDDLSPGGPD